MRFRASDVAAATNGKLVGRDVDIDGASFDSRSAISGKLFVPIVAVRDGHDFIDDALARGAAAYLTERPDQHHEGTGSAVEVADTTTAYLDLARWGRGRFPDRVVGVTGSVGKTSTKDLAKDVVARRWRTTANERSFNNDQGLPTTVINAPDDTEALILEMGMRGAGEIRRLCDVARPTIGVVTRVGSAHTELLGGIDGVAKAKAELVEALPADGTAILNADDERVAAMSKQTDAGVLTFGYAGEVRVADLALDRLGRAGFILQTPWGNERVRLDVSGEHMAINAAAAAAVGLVLGVPLADVVAALAHATLSPWRMEVTTTASGGVLINDAYNANPTSMRAALDTLAAIGATRRVAVLGLMAEIDDPVAEHKAVAEYARQRGIEVIAFETDLYGVGATSDPMAALGSIAGGDAVLVKGSRICGLERFVARLRDAELGTA